MPESFIGVLTYALIPCLGILVGSSVAVMRAPGARLISAFQHFAAGVVFAAVAVELLPRLHTLDSPIAMVVGFTLGIAAMLASKALFENAGIVVPMAVDLFIDGLLVAIGFAAGMLGGTVLLIGLSLETVALGLSTAPILLRRGMARFRAVSVMGVTGLVILLGVAAGYVIAGLSSGILAGVLGFGVASLLYLVTEELLAEAHEVQDTPIITATFFVGFLVPIVIAAI